MNRLARSAAITCLAILATGAFAQPVTGVWNGKLNLPAPKYPANITPEQKKFGENMLATFRAMKFKLDLKADKTFVMTVSGPASLPPQAKEPTKGKWVLQGRNIVITPEAKKGQQGPKPQPMTLKPAGKGYEVKLPSGPGQDPGKMIFSR